MKILGILAISLSLIIMGCGSADLASSASANRSAQSGLSEPAVDGAPAFSDTTVAKSATNTAYAANTGGGGGGGRQERAALVTQTTSLNQAQQSQAQTDRKIIRNAEVSLESDAPENAQKQITAIAESKGGFVVESQQSSSDVRAATRDIVTMTVRVPSENFAAALDEIRKTASRVVVETVKGQDVTEEFIDIEAALKAKKALELQFMEIMKRANTVEDALDVQRQLAEVRGEIEKIEGRKRFLENQASLSTIRIRLQTPAAISASSTGFGYRLTESFGSGLDVVLNFVLGLVTFLIAAIPFVLFIGLPAFFASRYFWKRQNRPMTVSEIAKEEIKDK